MKSIKFSLYFLLITFSYPLFAQASLSIIDGLIDFPASITDGQEIVFKCYVKNVGNEDFDGKLYLDYTANGDTFLHDEDESIFHDYELYLEDTNILPINDSIRISHIKTINVGFGGFQEGSNIVVLWPTGEVSEDINTPANDGRMSTIVILPPADSLHFQFSIHTATATNNIEQATAPRLVYIATQQQVFIQNNATVNYVEGVRFFDNYGRQIAKYAAPLQPLDVQMLPAGLCIAEITMQNGKVYQAKFVKQ